MGPTGSDICSTRIRRRRSRRNASGCDVRRRRKTPCDATAYHHAPTIFCTRAALLLSCIASITMAFPVFSMRRHLRSPVNRGPSACARLSPWQTTTSSRIPFSKLFSSPGGDGSDSEEEEWRAMVAAFQMYKAAYGNLKVPLRFVVPALPPWPEQAWGMKLGQKVAAIRTTGKFVESEGRRKLLEDMGFVWRLRTKLTPKEKGTKEVSFDQIYSALVAYREHEQNEKGILSVPSSFVVPDCDPWPENTRGLPLGKKISTIRSKSFLASNPGAKEMLQKIGFQLDGKVAANEARFHLVYEALKRYKEIYGDLLVPQPFVVPENSKEWPKETLGLRLGARVNAIRSQGTFINSNPERKEMLDEIGFAWSPPKSEGGGRRGRRRKEEIEAMEARKGAMSGMSDLERQDYSDSEMTSSALDSLFGATFEFGRDALPGISEDGEMDAPTWGLEGGKQQLEAVRRAEEEAQAVEEYKAPKDLAQSLEEAAARAIEVGVIEEVTSEEGHRIRKGKREKNIPWFNDDFGNEFVFDDVVEGLTVYKSIYGDFTNLTDENFVVPSPEDAFSDLDDDGDIFNNDDPAGLAASTMAKFQARRDVEIGEDLISSEIDMLQAEGEAPVASQRGVTLASEASIGGWPEHLASMPIGNIVKRIRDGSLEVKHLPERKAKLDALGFDWGDPKYFIDVPFEKAMCAMYAYYLVRGDMFVEADFVMPDEDPWPQALAGYEIGKAVRRIRELQNFLEAYHPDKVSLLRMIDFIWFPTLALPLDPNEPEMTPEMLKLSAMGHPDYANMIDIPMGLPDKIIADGPFFETDDPKLWWRKWHNWDYVQDYWYQLGRRDNAFVLRGNGYPQMADEHEAKYGPGLFKQINMTLTELEGGIEGKSDSELLVLLEKVKFFRDEMTDCTDIPIPEKENLLADLDYHLYTLSGGTEGSDSDRYEYEYEEVEVEEEFMEEEMPEDQNYDATEEAPDEHELDEEVDPEVIEEEDFDVDDELGFGSS